jgi:iron-sulfur cluster repair protein YtfE (RIC family)
MSSCTGDVVNRIVQVLHDEHAATVALMERFEQLLGKHRPGAAPNTQDPGVKQLLSELSVSLPGEVERHFAFEEDALFTYLAEAGDVGIGAHLTEEHRVMRPIGNRIAALARNAAAQGFDPAGWDEFRRLGSQLCDQLLAHVQKEEMALLPLLEESMDADTEARLYEEYVENQ